MVLRQGNVNILDSELRRFFHENHSAESRVIVYAYSLTQIEYIVRKSSFREKMSTQSGSNDEQANASSFRLWISGQKQIMVATSGFGVGIDYPSVRTVIFYGMPYSVEDMFQQFGRSGRDGHPSEAILLALAFDNQHVNLEMKSFVKNTDVCRPSLD